MKFKKGDIVNLRLTFESMDPNFDITLLTKSGEPVFLERQDLGELEFIGRPTPMYQVTYHKKFDTNVYISIDKYESIADFMERNPDYEPIELYQPSKEVIKKSILEDQIKDWKPKLSCRDCKFKGDPLACNGCIAYGHWEGKDE